MPIDTKKFKRVTRGLKWNRRTKTALFDVLAPGSKERFRRVLPFASSQEAMAAFMSFRAHVKAGHRPDEVGDATEEAAVPEQSTFTEYVTRYLDSIWGGTALSTRRRNMSSLNSYLLPFFGSKKLNEIAEIDAKDFKTWCRTRVNSEGAPKPLAPPTINFALRRFREVMNNAKTRKLLESIPPIKFEKETENKNEFNPEEESAFLAAFDDIDGFRRHLTEHRKLAEIIYVEFRQNDPFAGKRRYGSGLDPASDAALAYFHRFQRSKEWFIAALHTGLRRGDLIDLRRPSVRFAEGLVTRTMKKTGKVTMVPMSDTLRETFTVAMSRSVAAITDHVFLTEEGIPYPEITIRRYFAIAKSIAGITRRFRINDLRHTFASDLASDGFSTLVLRDLLGHTTTKQSERYARPNPQVAEAVRASLERRGKADDPSLSLTADALQDLLNATAQRALTDDERNQLSKLIGSSLTRVSATQTDTGDTKTFSDGEKAVS